MPHSGQATHLTASAPTASGPFSLDESLDYFLCDESGFGRAMQLMESTTSESQTPAAAPAAAPAAVPMTPEEASAVIAIVNGSGVCRSHIGAAVIDMERKRLELYQFIDNDAGQKLDMLTRRLQPKVSLIPNAAGAEAFQYACDFKLEAEVTPWDRNKFDDAAGRDSVLQYCAGSERVLDVELKNKEYALVAAGGLFSFVCENGVAGLLPKSLQLVVQGSENGLALDYDTIGNLELFSSSSGGSAGHKDSLFAFLNKTQTLIGSRFLRACVFEPSTSIPEISARQDCVQELIQNEELFDKLADFFQQLQVDMDVVTTRLTSTPRGQGSALLESQIDCVVYLKHVLSLLPLLVTAMRSCRSELFRRFANLLSGETYAAIRAQVNLFICEECFVTRGSLSFKSSKAFALRDNLDANLQMQRQIYGETLEQLNELVEELNRRFGYSGALRLVYNVNRGYHLDIPQARLEDQPLPPTFMNRMAERNSVRCTTPEVAHKDSHVRKITQTIVALSHVVMQPLLAFLQERNQMDSIYGLKDTIAYLDFLLSLAIVAKENDLKRPEFADITKMKGCAHPIFLHLSKTSPGRSVVSNDFDMRATSSLMMVTGPNMSGKSSFVRQIALLYILAQIGSFVPATEPPKIRLVTRILTRIGCDDDLVSNSSSYMNEAAQVQYILSKADENSLVIIDEMGRGTSEEEGVGLCVAVCEALLRKKTFTLFATHFHDLVRLQNLYPLINSYQMDYKPVKSADGGEFLNFTHKVKVRPLDDNKVEGLAYGIELAEKLGTMHVVASAARELLPRVDVYRPALMTETTVLKRSLLLARHLQVMSRRSDLREKSAIGVYLAEIAKKTQTEKTTEAEATFM